MPASSVVALDEVIVTQDPDDPTRLSQENAVNEELVDEFNSTDKVGEGEQ
jgi:hypothetical protein